MKQLITAMRQIYLQNNMKYPQRLCFNRSTSSNIPTHCTIEIKLNFGNVKKVSSFCHILTLFSVFSLGAVNKLS